MEILWILIAAYGVTFGLQHKVLFLHERHPLLDKLLRCTYCTGFHAGYLSYGGLYIGNGEWDKLTLGTALLAAFASSAFAYLIDTLARFLESQCEPIEADE